MKQRDKNNRRNRWTVLIAFGVIIILLNTFLLNFFYNPHRNMNMDMKREHFISLKQDIQGNLLPAGKYRCCLEKPCMYCIEKTSGHGEGAECSCMEDIINGVHPCGECIGEILEGHGNSFLAKYFARAIAEKTGNIEAIREIISEKYGIPAEEQL